MLAKTRKKSALRKINGPTHESEVSCGWEADVIRRAFLSRNGYWSSQQLTASNGQLVIMHLSFHIDYHSSSHSPCGSSRVYHCLLAFLNLQVFLSSKLPAVSRNTFLATDCDALKPGEWPRDWSVFPVPTVEPVIPEDADHQ